MSITRGQEKTHIVIRQTQVQFLAAILHNHGILKSESALCDSSSLSVKWGVGGKDSRRTTQPIFWPIGQSQ
jgi:hypothetical protein